MAQVVDLKYAARPAFLPFHSRSKRFSVLVCHRRAGKTVAAINDLVQRALNVDTAKRPNPKYGYVAPYRSQAKEIAWQYLKDSTNGLPGRTVSESELYVRLHNGATIKLYGADNPDSLRGGYFDGVILDEYGDMAGSVYTQIIRPMISDRKGWVVFMGTPKGKNNFYEKREQARKDTAGWYYLCLKASESGHLPQEELDDARASMDEDEYETEYECSFEASIKGSYYGKQMGALYDAGHITDVPADVTKPVDLTFDLGFSDATAVWFHQVVAGQIRVVNHYENNNVSIDSILQDLQDKADEEGYRIGTLYLPHDAKAKRLGTGKSIVEQILAHGYKCEVLPRLDLKDGIAAVRKTLPFCWFDATNCYEGVEHLKAYQRKWDADKQVFSNTPLHDISSHTADAFRYLCLVVSDTDLKKSKQVKLRPLSSSEGRRQWELQAEVNTVQKTGITLDELFSSQARAPRSTRL